VVALSRLAVGNAAMENELEAAARQAASTLASLSSKEIVKTAIHNYESKLRESDRDSYLKCKKLYEQELEKRK
jgi:hypothetical protein